MKTGTRLLTVGLVSLVMCGCATMNTVRPMATDVDAKVKNLQPPAGKALLYVVRPTFVGKPFGGDVSANGVFVGRTQGGMYVYAVLAPGDYTISVTGQDSGAEVPLTLEAGKTYYVYQSVYPGVFKGLTGLKLVSEEEGRNALQQCKLGDKLGANVVP